jgi:hypothetical protein
VETGAAKLHLYEAGKLRGKSTGNRGSTHLNNPRFRTRQSRQIRMGMMM